MKRLGYCARLFQTLALILATTAVSGKAANTSQKPIVSGRLVSNNDGNWQVAIVNERRLMCSGSLIRKNVILTSAICVKDLELSELIVRAGSKTFKKGGQVRRVVESAHHPQYQQDEHGFNIALMKLRNPFNITVGNVETTRLPTANQLEMPSSVFIYGWGISSLIANGTLSKRLRVSKYKVYSDKKCLRYLPENDRNNVENTFCVGDRTKQADICIDDIGGPAMNQNSVQYGVISHAGACSSDNSIVLTSIVPHLPWIRGVIKAWKSPNGSNNRTV